MSVKPIMFSVPMVRAKREGEKTHTRRIAHRQDIFIRNGEPWVSNGGNSEVLFVPRFAVGDILWVREAWRVDASFDHLSPKQIEARCIFAGHKTGWAPIAYEAGGYSPSWGTNGWHELGRKRASMHMPRWASRLTLEVTGVKIERLQDISEADAKAEGIAPDLSGRQTIVGWRNYEGGPSFVSAIASYCTLWNSINGAGSWDANPWVVAVIFKVHRMNVDAFLAARGDSPPVSRPPRAKEIV